MGGREGEGVDKKPCTWDKSDSPDWLDWRLQWQARMLLKTASITGVFIAEVRVRFDGLSLFPRRGSVGVS